MKSLELHDLIAVRDPYTAVEETASANPRLATVYATAGKLQLRSRLSREPGTSSTAKKKIVAEGRISGRKISPSLSLIIFLVEVQKPRIGRRGNKRLLFDRGPIEIDWLTD